MAYTAHKDPDMIKEHEEDDAELDEKVLEVIYDSYICRPNCW
jgi:hypothetical protein